MEDHFLHCVLRSAQKFDFWTEGGPFLMLCFKVRSSIIINVRNTEILCFRICHFIIYVRITKGGLFLMLRFEVRPVIRQVRKADLFLYNIWSGRTFTLGGPNIMRHRDIWKFNIWKVGQKALLPPPPSSFRPGCDILTIRTCTHVAVITWTCTYTSEKKIR